MKKIKLPLEMANGVMVRTIDELKENWDLTKVVEHFVSGKLVTWLRDRYYAELADKVATLDVEGDSIELQKSLCNIFDVEYDEKNVANMDELDKRKRKAEILRQYTSDDRVLKHVDNVAFDQEELSDLLDDNNVREIYLFNNKFHIPLTVEGKCYVGVGNVTVYIGENEAFEIGNLDVSFENVHFEGEHAIGMRKIGLMYRIGNCVKKDYRVALEWFHKAWDAGDIGAARSIAITYLEGYGVEKDDSKVEYWLKKGADAGYLNCITDIAYYYLQGEHVTKDYEQALKYYRMGAEQNNGYSTEILGVMYQNGEGVEKDIDKALEYYMKAVELGTDRAANRIAYIFRDGEGVEKNLEESFKWHKKAADMGNALACLNTGSNYQDGRGTDKNLVKALEYFVKSAEAGNDLACEFAGNAYFEGEGTERDYKKAFEYYKKAEKCNNWCLYRLGQMYNDGLYVDRNLEKAAEYYEKAVRNGCFVGAYEIAGIARSYELGEEGVEMDKKEAYRLYKLASELGDTTSAPDGIARLQADYGNK